MDIRKLLSKQRPTSSSSSSPSTKVIDLTAANQSRNQPQCLLESQKAALSLQCNLPCCDLSSCKPTHLQIDRALTVRSSVDGKRKRYFNPQHLQDFRWSVLCKTTAKVYCQICRYAVNNRLLLSHKGEPTFVSTGFNNWNKGKIPFESHERSDFHRESVMKTTHLLNSDSVICQLVSSTKKIQRLNFDCLIEQLECMRLLARKGDAFRSHVETEGNLRQLLHHTSRHLPHMKTYLKDNRYLSPTIISELLSEMYREVMQQIVSEVQTAGYFSIIMDETSDISGKEQCAIVLRYVDKSYVVHEELLGLYEAEKCDAESLTKIIKTTLLSLNIDIKMARGQNYDGASVLQGNISGVAKRIRDIVDKAVSLHCLNHNLNLILQEAAKVNSIVSSCLSTVQLLCSVIRDSPKRLAVFRSLQSGKPDSTSLKPLCPTRWTCRISSLNSILDNYETAMETLEWIVESGNKQSEGYKQAPGLIAALEKFSTLFGLRMCQTVFAPVEEFAKQLQSKDICVQTVMLIQKSLKRFLAEKRSDEHFKKLYLSCVDEAAEKDIGTPKDSLPRRRKAPKRLDDYVRLDGCASSRTDDFDNTEKYYRQAYFEVLDHVIRCIEERFNQETLAYLISLEKMIIESFDENCPHFSCSSDELQRKFPLLKGDVNFERLKSELSLLPSTFVSVCPEVKQVTSMDTVRDFLNKANMNVTFEEFGNLVRLYLTVPVSNASAERGFSTLRRVKSYLRSRVSQEHLNHFVVLHAHKELTDSIDLIKIAKNFVKANERRIHHFG